MTELTQLFAEFADGAPGAADKLLSIVYDELRRLAARKLAHESPGRTLQPTALVHEAWIRLSAQDGSRWNDRAHFFAIAAQAMRRILIDHARRKRADKRGGDRQRITLQTDLTPPLDSKRCSSRRSTLAPAASAAARKALAT